ncbi:MAG: class I SAM-dependent methyltransferase [Clostridia bacterium]|nr:class I SAM-dependent methyltransferase [Clostridia bacterium]
MLRSLSLINKVQSKKDIPEKETWLKYLFCTAEKNVNLRNVEDINNISSKVTLNYVKGTLEVLDEEEKTGFLSPKEYSYIEDTLKWGEVAKCGLKIDRARWTQKGYDLNIHNEASSEIYREDVKKSDYIVYILIKTHGLVGQSVQGEVNLDVSKELTNLIHSNLIEKESLEKVLVVLNKCIITPIRPGLYDKVKSSVNKAIRDIVNNKYKRDSFDDKQYLLDRFKKLFPNKSVDEFQKIEKKFTSTVCKKLAYVFENFELWYPYSALSNYSLEQIIKVFLIVANKVQTTKRHINFVPFMDEVYYMYNGMKVKNLFKQRIIESYLDDQSIEDFAKGKISSNVHLSFGFKATYNAYLIGIKFSSQARRLIEFCEVAYGTNELYNQAVYMLYDLFDFRRDKYDRFYNEISYLSTMNSTINYKAVILDYIKGNTCLDVGPGGGAMLDSIEASGKVKRVIGIDISQNVIEELNNKKTKENKKWEVIKGDALNLKDFFKKGEIDTIIFCSVIHELFSYIETDGKKFNHKTIEKAIKSCYDVLPVGGRIIIRDGIMSETDKNRIIVFKNKKDIDFLNKYCKDFKGREIKYKKINENTVQMKENDAMEFLYTYTWGEESYPMEVQEQFGYYTPSAYIEMFKKIGDFKVVECKHYLQEGYEEHLLEKIEFYDENMIPCRLPDSTCIIVVEKM